MIDFPEMATEEDTLPLVNLSEQERNDIGMRVCREIDAWETRRNALMPRWEKHEQLYACDESATSLNSVEGIGTYPFSVWRSKCDSAAGDLVSGILSASPIVQCIEEGPEGSNEDGVERALMQMSERSRFPRVFPLAVHTSFNTNTGVLRTRPTTDKEGAVNGVETDWFHPRHVCFYPAAVDSVSKCRTVGHRFYQGLWEIEEKQKEKAYYHYSEEIVTGDDPDRDDTIPGRFDKVTTAGSDTLELEDGFVECWEVITRCRIKGEWKLYIGVVARSSQKLLSLQAYPYSRPWYDIVRPLQTEKKLLTNDSVAQGVQGMCLAVQDLMNAIVGGAYMTAYPFDAQKFAWAIEEFKQLIDGTVGISRISSSQNLPADTKATAINAITAGDERRQGTYLDNAAESVEGVFGMFLEYLRKHREALGAAYGGAVAAVTPEALEKQYRLEVTGRSGASNPNTILQKLQFLMQVASNPQSTLDYAKIEERAVDALDLPFDTSALAKGWLTQVVGMATQMEAQGIDPMQALAMGVQEMLANGAIGEGGQPPQTLPEPGMGAPLGIPEEPEGPEDGGIAAMLAGALAGGAGGDPGAGPIPYPGGSE
jgi:hypothetical protein